MLAADAGSLDERGGFVPTNNVKAETRVTNASRGSFFFIAPCRSAFSSTQRTTNNIISGRQNASSSSPITSPAASGQPSTYQVTYQVRADG